MRRLPSPADVLRLPRINDICLKAFRYFLLKKIQVQGFTALHKCSIKRQVNGITERRAQMGGTSQFQRKIREKVNTISGNVQTANAIIMATDIRIIFLCCWSRSLWREDNRCPVFLLCVFSVHAIKPYTMANKKTGTRRKMMKVAVTNLFWVSLLSNAGAQSDSQCGLLS